MTTMADSINFILSYIAYPVLFLVMNRFVKMPNFKTSPKSFWNIGFVIFSFLFSLFTIPLFIYYAIPIIDFINGLSSYILGIAPFLGIIKGFFFFLLVFVILVGYVVLKWVVKFFLDLVQGDNILPIEDAFYSVAKPDFLLTKYTWLKKRISFINIFGTAILIALIPYLYQKLVLGLAVGIVLITLLVLKEIVLFFKFLQLEEVKQKNSEPEEDGKPDFNLNQYERLWRYYVNSPFAEKRLITARKLVNISPSIDTQNVKEFSLPGMNSRGYLKLLKLPSINQNILDLREKLSSPPHGKNIIASGLDAEVSLLTVWDRVTEILNNGENVLVLLPERNLPEILLEGKQELNSYYKNCLDWVRRALDELLDVHYFTVQAFSALHPETINCNLLITSSYDLLEGRNTLELNKDWFDNIKFILVVSYEDQIKTGNFNNLILSNVLRRLKIDCQLAVVSDTQKELETSVRSAFERHPDIEDIETGFIHARQQYYFIWRDEGLSFANYFLQGHHGNIDLGDAMLLMLPAINLKTTDIQFYNPDKWAVKEFIEETQKIISRIDAAKLPDPETWNSAEILLRRLVGEIHNHNFYTRQREGFAVVYDYAYNVGETLSEALSFYSNAEMVHVLSAPYIFREYFSANIHYFKNSPVRSLGVILQRTPYTIAYSLFKILRNDNLSEKEVESKLKLNEIAFALNRKHTIIENLENLWIKYLQIKESDIKGLLKVKEEEIFEPSEKGRSYAFVQNSYFDKGNIPNITFDFESEVYIQENTPTGSVVLDIIPKGLLFQKYLIGQVHVFKGKTYGIRSYDESNFEHPVLWVQLDNTQGKIAGYRPAIEIKLTNSDEKGHNLIDTQLLNNTYRISLCEGEFEVFTHGYFKTTEQFNLYNSQNFYPTEGSQRLYLSRKYKFGRYILLELPFEKFQTHFDVADFMLHEQTLATLLNESLRTFFPSMWTYVHATALHGNEIICHLTDDKGFIQPRLRLDDKHLLKKENTLQIMIFEDCAFDMGIVGSVYRNIEYVLTVLEDYMHFCGSETIIPSKVPIDESPIGGVGFQDCEAPEDFVELEQVQFESNTNPVYMDLPELYLNFGHKDTPEWLRLQGAQKLLTIMRAGKENEITEKRQQFLFGRETVRETRSDHQCDFCGRWENIAVIKTIQNDGREICSVCIKTCVTTCDQLVECINISRQFFKERYDISLPDNVEIKYVNTSTLNKYKKGFVPTPRFDHRVAGLAFSDKKIMVENGSPEANTMGILVHEFVHIWQYHHLNMDRMRADYGEFLVEGHATWVEIEARTKINPEVNWEDLIAPLSRKDEYGEGFRLIKKMVLRYNENPFVFLQRLYPI